MGTGAQRLMSVGTEKTPAWMIEFTGGRKVFATMYESHESWAFKANTKDNRVLVINDCHNFWETFMVKLVDFFRTGEAKVPHEQTVAGIELRDKMLWRWKSRIPGWTWICNPQAESRKPALSFEKALAFCPLIDKKNARTGVSCSGVLVCCVRSSGQSR